MIEVVNRGALEERFGAWPSFHHAEVHGVRLDSGQQGARSPSLELDVHVFAVKGLRPDGRLDFVRHTLATLLFEGIVEV